MPEIDKKCRDCFKWEYFDDYEGMPDHGGNKTKDGDGKGGEPEDPPPDPWSILRGAWKVRASATRYRPLRGCE
jgi:hypothetical protein